MVDDGETIKTQDLKKFVSDCFVAVGVCRSYSDIMSESIVGADIIGHRSHGVFRLDKFIMDGHSGNLDVEAEPKIEKESIATVWVDGHNALGAVVGSYCMKIAIQKAKLIGAAVVVCNNSNNFGVASFYAKQALKHGLLGFVLTNSSPLMLPNRAKYPILGTNPISLAAPGLSGDFFLLDMATTVTSGGNIERTFLNNEILPRGYAFNAAFLPETNADVALKTGCFLPLGSSEELGSYKGTGLSMMVDILCGVLGGAFYSHMVGVWLGRMFKKKANCGSFFLAIDPKFFSPEFENRLTEYMSLLRNLEPRDPKKTVRVPGDKSREMAKAIGTTGGIWYPNYVIKNIKTIANTLNLKVPPFIPKIKEVKLSPSEIDSLDQSKEIEQQKLNEEKSNHSKEQNVQKKYGKVEESQKENEPEMNSKEETE